MGLPGLSMVIGVKIIGDAIACMNAKPTGAVAGWAHSMVPK